MIFWLLPFQSVVFTFIFHRALPDAAATSLSGKRIALIYLFLGENKKFSIDFRNTQQIVYNQFRIFYLQPFFSSILN